MTVTIAIGLSGCATGGRPRVVDRHVEPPTFEEVAAAHNERVGRLDRVWGRAVVELEYRDDKDRRQREQGEGHLQIRQPGDFALSIGKLGETYAWLGADAERFWFFDKFDEPRAVIGRHENIGKPCAQSLGLPADPLLMIDLMGIAPMDLTEAGSTSWSDDGRWIVASLFGRRTMELMYFDPKTMRPVRIEFDAPDGEAEIVSTLEQDEPVRQSDEGGFFPRMATRIEIYHPSSQTRVTLHLEQLQDGRTGRGKLSDAAFDFDSLRQAFGPKHIEVLDFDCDHPAIPQ